MDLAQDPHATGSITRPTSRALSSRLLGMLLLSLLVSSVMTRQLIADSPPNVLFLLSDDQAWDDYGFMGNEIVQTPNLDRLAKQSLVFEKGYVVAPLCRPSLASIISGLHPHQHGVVGNDVSPLRRQARHDEDRPVVENFHRNPSMIRFLAERGYRSFQSGKWWEGSWEDAGFTDGMTHGNPLKGGRCGDDGLKIGRETLKPVQDFMRDSVESDVPFFVWYAPCLPHTPHRPPEEFVKRYRDHGLNKDTMNYYAMCEWYDSTCGELVQTLDDLAIRDNTLIVSVCDNGWRARSDSDIELPQDWWPNYAPKSKGSPYESGIRTPILFSLPKSIPPQRSPSFASSLDLFPTIASICGFDAPDSLPGYDLTKQKRDGVKGATYSIHNMNPNDPWETLLYTWIRAGKWKLIRRHPGRDTTKYATVNQWDQTPVHLFDISQDPTESRNLANEHRDAVRILDQALQAEFPDHLLPKIVPQGETTQ